MMVIVVKDKSRTIIGKVMSLSHMYTAGKA